MATNMPQTIDLETIVKNWAREEFDDTATKKQKQLRAKEIRDKQTYLNIKIDWSDVLFSDVTSWPPLKEEQVSPAESPQKQSVAVSHGGKASALMGDSQKPASSTLFRSKFVNNTKEPQEYILKTEKTTTSTCETNIESGYTKGFSMEVTLKSPCEVLEASAGYSREYSLSNSRGESFEEQLTWGVESQLTVKEGSVAEAELVVSERKFSGRFMIKSTISGPVYVTFTNLRDNNSFVKKTSHTIDQIIQEFLKVERRKGKSYDFVEVDDETGVVTITTQGCCNFRFGVSQEVKVNQRALTEQEKQEFSKL